MGSQIMLASSGSQAKQLLLDRARRTLEQPEVEALQEKLQQVYIIRVAQYIVINKVINPLCSVLVVMPMISMHLAMISPNCYSEVNIAQIM